FGNPRDLCSASIKPCSPTSMPTTSFAPNRAIAILLRPPPQPASRHLFPLNQFASKCAARNRLTKSSTDSSNNFPSYCPHKSLKSLSVVLFNELRSSIKIPFLPKLER